NQKKRSQNRKFLAWPLLANGAYQLPGTQKTEYGKSQAVQKQTAVGEQVLQAQGFQDEEVRGHIPDAECAPQVPVRWPVEGQDAQVFGPIGAGHFRQEQRFFEGLPPIAGLQHMKMKVIRGGAKKHFSPESSPKP